MHDALLVQVCQARQDLRDVHGGQALWQRAKAAGPNQPRQRAVLHEFEDDVQVRARLEAAQVLDDVAVAQRLEQLELAHHGGERVGRRAGERDLLDRDDVARRRVHALVHLEFVVFVLARACVQKECKGMHAAAAPPAACGGGATHKRAQRTHLAVRAAPELLADQEAVAEDRLPDRLLLLLLRGGRRHHCQQGLSSFEREAVRPFAGVDAHSSSCCALAGPRHVHGNSNS